MMNPTDELIEIARTGYTTCIRGKAEHVAISNKMIHIFIDQ